MELRILGSHNYESRDTRLSSYLVDGVLALDAGSITRALTFDEQLGVKAVLLSHRHFDHTRDLIPLGLLARNSRVTIEVIGFDDTIDFVRTNLLDTRNVPDFTTTPSAEEPAYRFRVVKLHQEFKLLAYSVALVPVPHAVPAAGMQISDGDVKLFYAGDAGPGVAEALKGVSPDVLLTEVTFGNENEAVALQVGHLTPRNLQTVLEQFRADHGYLPIVVASHIQPQWEGAVRGELKEVSRELGNEIIVPQADDSLKL
jgi:3',5'-cyclic-nucleotide phosphodiesterase